MRMTTASDTKTYSSRFKDVTYTELGNTGMYVSEVGFGAYRIHSNIPEHKDALKMALLKGINLIDTSANYTDGESETVIGNVLDELILEKKLGREEVVLVSKAGYLQGQNFEKSQQRKKQGIPYPDLVDYADGLEHCIHPTFLEDQLQRSLRRLNVVYLDVLLLHNPEYFLSYAEKHNKPKAETHQEYYRRIKQAFEYLEEQVDRGRIKYYGISSNTFPSPASEYTHTSLLKVLEIASSIRKDHHCRVIQCPLNLAETSAVALQNNDDLSVTALCKEAGVGLLINRPLNGIVNGKLVRFADYFVDEDVSTIEIDDHIQELVHFEGTFESIELDTIIADPQLETQFRGLFNIGQTLSQYWTSFRDIEHWKDVMTYSLLPQMETAMEFVADKPLSQDQETWFNDYVFQVNRLFKLMSNYFKSYAASRSDSIKHAIYESFPEWKEPTLSQIAINAIRSVPGVSCVLLGMRKEEYVTDALIALQKDPELSHNETAWNAIEEIVKSLA
jgi:aryl-alcohol dehydrogenase-like predicted oxidoreductase